MGQKKESGDKKTHAKNTAQGGQKAGAKSHSTAKGGSKAGAPAKMSRGRRIVLFVVAILALIALLTGLFLGDLHLQNEAHKEDVDPYDDLRLSRYVTLPDYRSFTVEPDAPEAVTDEDVDAEIESRLQEAAGTEYETEGTVETGDTLTISYTATLPDGTELPAQSSESAMVTLAEGDVTTATEIDVIEGFRESLLGKEIGKTYDVDLTFPDPYGADPDLSGQDVTFEIAIVNRAVVNPPELTDDYVSGISEADTVEEYRALVKTELEEEAKNAAVSTTQLKLLDRIVEAAEVKKYPDDLVDDEREMYDDQYRARYDMYYNGLSWEQFLEENLDVAADDYESYLDEQARSMVKNKFVIYALADEEKIEFPEETYQNRLTVMQLQYGYQTASEFQRATGMSPAAYAERYYNYYGMRASVLLEEVLDALYKGED